VEAASFNGIDNQLSFFLQSDALVAATVAKVAGMVEVTSDGSVLDKDK
jgi:hypothetical protein